MNIVQKNKYRKREYVYVKQWEQSQILFRLNLMSIKGMLMDISLGGPPNCAPSLNDIP